ncbi:MAG: hypothetical protein ACJ750_04930 [Gaiellaceae bacterium]
MTQDPAFIRIDAIVTPHLNFAGSGTARFNAVLSERLGVPLLEVTDPRVSMCSRPLFSVKVGDLPAHEAELVAAIIDRVPAWEVFLHDYAGLPLEERLARGAEIVWCGNDEVRGKVGLLNGRLESAWAPGLIFDERRFPDAEISVFSFGMAHKVRTDLFRGLRDLLERSGSSYALYMSNASHETATLEDEQLVFDEMRAIFPTGLYFLGHISDVAVYNYLRTTTFYAAFFRGGVRSNNSSVASAMQYGAVVITNLDESSPAYLRHLDNVIDLNHCSELPTDADVLRRIGERARETAAEVSWDRLVDRIGARDSLT